MFSFAAPDRCLIMDNDIPAGRAVIRDHFGRAQKSGLGQNDVSLFPEADLAEAFQRRRTPAQRARTVYITFGHQMTAEGTVHGHPPFLFLCVFGARCFFYHSTGG